MSPQYAPYFERQGRSTLRGEILAQTLVVALTLFGVNFVSTSYIGILPEIFLTSGSWKLEKVAIFCRQSQNSLRKLWPAYPCIPGFMTSQCGLLRKDDGIGCSVIAPNCVKCHASDWLGTLFIV